MNFDHILVIGFGGPEKPEDVRPFLEFVTRGKRIPPQRLEEVRHHYEMIGGISPYNAHVAALVKKLEASLLNKGITLPVLTGMKNWHPFMADTVAKIRSRGLKKGIGIVLAPQRSEASFEKYILTVEEAKSENSFPGLEYEYLKPWHDHPLFIRAQAAQADSVLNALDAGEREGLELLFTAHSIPVEMQGASGYAREFGVTSSLVAHELGFESWSLVYQSRSGNPAQPWLEPDVIQKIRELAARGRRSVLIIPAGFVNDNVEVLYDLDIEAREAAEKAGVRYHRASAVMDHPHFVEMLAAMIEESLARQPF